MTTPMTTEAELRHAVIDRLIAASLRDVTTAREATLENWRNLGGKSATQRAKTDTSQA